MCELSKLSQVTVGSAKAVVLEAVLARGLVGSAATPWVAEHYLEQ